MLRRTLLLAAASAGLPGGKALAQANIAPDPTPRLPPQPGQGPPAEDARFLRDAAALSDAQVEAAKTAVEKAGEEEARRLAAGIAERHRRLAEQIRGLARGRGIAVEAPGAGGGGASGGRPAAAKQRLEGLRASAAPGGDADREFLAAQIEVHPVLVEMYQTEASHSTDRELGRFAITTLVGLQEDFAAAARLGERHGLRRPDRLLANPPQYGPGAGPPR